MHVQCFELNTIEDEEEEEEEEDPVGQCIARNTKVAASLRSKHKRQNYPKTKAPP